MAIYDVGNRGSKPNIEKMIMYRIRSRPPIPCRTMQTLNVNAVTNNNTNENMI